MAKNTHSETFTSISDFVEYAKGPQSCDLGQRHSRMEGRDKWSGTSTFNEACKLAETGWSTKRRVLNDQVSAIVNEAIEGGWGVNGITFDYSEYGTDVDVDRFLMGEPKNMIEWQPTTDRPAIRLVMSTCYSAMVEADDIIKRGATVAALVEALGQAGISLELWVESTTGWDENKHAQVFVRVKSFTEPLDIDAFVYCAAHPSFLRRLCFGAWERFPRRVREAMRITGYGGYGHANTAQDYSPVGGADIAVPSMESGYNDPLLRDPLGWIKQTIQDLNLRAA